MIGVYKVIKYITNSLFCILLSFIFFNCDNVPSHVKYNNVFDNHGSFDNNPPVLNLEVSPDTGDISQEFTFDASGCYEPELPGIDLAFRWDFNGDLIWDTDWSSQKIIKKKFEDLESYDYHTGNSFNIVNLLVKGGKNKEYTISDTIYVNSYPLAQLDSWHYEFLDPELIYFDASKSLDTEDKKNLLYRWDFNNNGNWDIDWNADPKTSHRFSNQKSWILKLQVKDKLGYENSTIITYDIFNLEGLIAYYPFNGNVSDISGNGNNGLNNGAVFMKNDSAIYFDGIDDYIDLGNNKIFKSAQDLSIVTSVTFYKFSSDSSPGSGIFTNNQPNEFKYGYNLVTDEQGQISARVGNIYSLIGCCDTKLYKNTVYFFCNSIWADEYTNRIGYAFNYWFNDESIYFWNSLKLNRGYIAYSENSHTTIGKVNDLYFNGVIDYLILFNRIVQPDEYKSLYENAIID